MNRPIDWKRFALLVVFVNAYALVASCGSSDDSSDNTAAPVSITAQPVSTTVVAGQPATFSIIATGDGLGYQWQRSVDSGGTFNNIAGAVASTYSIPVVDTSLSGYQYRVVVTGTAGAVTSSAATLSVAPAPTPANITVQPTDQTVTAGASVSFSVTASGTSLTYQWQLSIEGITYTAIVGATSATLTLTTVTVANNGTRYRAVISNSVSTVTSNPVLLTVNPTPIAPSISAQPAATSTTAPQAATFTVVASGTPAPNYQWQFSVDSGTTYTDIVGATAASYTTPATTVANNGSLYRVRVFNAAGTVVSSVVVLTVLPGPVAPSITTQPTNQSVTAPSAATFTVAANGTPTPTYQWQLSPDGGVTFANINGATGSTFTTSATAVADSGKRYRVVVTNGSGSVTSNAVTLTVSAAATASLTVTRLAAGLFHTCAIRPDTTVACWGRNFSGELGDGTVTARLLPTSVVGLAGVTSLAPGASATHECALKSDQTVVCWGDNENGQIGDGSQVNRSTPTAVPGLTGIVAVVVGRQHTCALRADGTVACWGLNYYGELGVSNVVTAYSPRPVTVPGLGGVTGISASGDSNCVTKADATVTCWGWNSSGQLGNGTLTDSFVPLPVTGVTDGVLLSSGVATVCALRVGAIVSCWGDNTKGELGYANPPIRSTVPQPVPNISGVVGLSGADFSTCAVFSSGLMNCWGYNQHGELGDGTLIDKLPPNPVVGLTGVLASANGALHTCALKSDGSIYCWGNNDDGQLGDGTLVGKTVPTLVPGFVALH